MKALIVVAALLFSTSATAQTVIVKKSDLDLTKPADRVVLNQRIKAAGNAFCRQRIDGIEATPRQQQLCREGVRKEVISKL